MFACDADKLVDGEPVAVLKSTGITHRDQPLVSNTVDGVYVSAGELSDDYGVSEAGDRVEIDALGLESFEQVVGALGVARVGVGQAVVEEEQGLWVVAGRDWCAWCDRCLELLEGLPRTRCDEAAAVGERGGAAQFSLLDECALETGVLCADGKFCDAAGDDRNVG